jgi:hypothetical protein
VLNRGGVERAARALGALDVKVVDEEGGDGRRASDAVRRASDAVGAVAGQASAGMGQASAASAGIPRENRRGRGAFWWRRELDCEE